LKLGFSKLEILFDRQTRSEACLPYRHLTKPGVEFRQETVVHIDPERRRVTTDAATYDADYDADYVVVALGADYDVPATPGFAEGGFEYYSVEGAERLRDELAGFPGVGRRRGVFAERAARAAADDITAKIRGDGGAHPLDGAEKAGFGAVRRARWFGL